MLERVDINGYENINAVYVYDANFIDYLKHEEVNGVIHHNSVNFYETFTTVCVSVGHKMIILRFNAIPSHKWSPSMANFLVSSVLLYLKNTTDKRIKRIVKAFETLARDYHCTSGTVSHHNKVTSNYG